MKSIKQLTAVSSLALLGLGAAPTASALDLTYIEGTGGTVSTTWVAYGDGLSYSLPTLAVLYEYYVGQYEAGNYNPYNIKSSPGSIKDLTVIGTGSSGDPINTNFVGMDNAYPTPNSDGIEFFSTVTTADPDQVSPFVGDQADTWDIRLTALDGFVGDESPVFFFNNNQTNSGDAEDQNLAIWAALTLYDDAGVLQPLTFYFTNDGNAYAPITALDPRLDGTAGTGTLGAPTDPDAGDNTSTDYVLSGGQVCYDPDAPLPNVVSCDTQGAIAINHNLGADQAVYAVVFPTLNEYLALADFGGYDVLSINWWMGCDPATTADCDGALGNPGRSLNNGYEQLFIGTVTSVTTVPEPATLALLGSALLGFAAMRRRKA